MKKMKKQFEIAAVMVAIMVLSVLTAMPVMSENENITNMNKTNGDNTAKYIFDERGMIIGTAIASEPSVSILEHPFSIAATSDLAAISDLIGKIVFESDRDGDHEIYVMDANGTNVTQLTRNTVRDATSAWSPDGKRIAFASNRDGDYEIYVMNSDGSNVVKLTKNSIVDITPSWSPDGKRIAFRSGESGRTTGIYVMNANGSDLKCLAEPQAFINNQAWSLNGSEIVFSREYGEGGGEIYVMNSTDGSNKRRLIKPLFSRGDKMNDGAPAWSPVGDKMVFCSFRHGYTEVAGGWSAKGEIYVMDTNGSNLVRLTYDPYYTDYSPSWSPDGKRIVFDSERDGDWEIYVMDADGTNVTQLTKNTADDNCPNWWSPRVWDSGIYDTNGTISETLPALGAPTSGRWIGNTSQGKAVAFDVTNTQVNNFSISYSYSCSPGYGYGPATFIIFFPHYIVENKFQYDSIKTTIYGEFTSPNFATGTFRDTWTQPSGGTCDSGNIKWSARRVRTTGDINMSESTPTPKTHSTGPLTISQTWTADLDEGEVGAGTDSDIWFEAETATERYITPMNGATIAKVGTTSVGLDGCRKAPLSSSRININDLPEGTYVCVRTNLGRYSQFRVNAPVGPSPGTLNIGYTTGEVIP